MVNARAAQTDAEKQWKDLAAPALNDHA